MLLVSELQCIDYIRQQNRHVSNLSEARINKLHVLDRFIR